MVARVGGYYGTAFQGFRGVIQGDPLSPTIFNVVVDAVVQHWVEEMVEGAGGQGRRSQEGRHQNSHFYVDDGMMALSDLVWLQGEFITLVGMFDWVGLRENVEKTVGMVCHPFQTAVTQLEAAYERHIMGVGPSYWERQRVQVQCLEYGEEMTLRLI